MKGLKLLSLLLASLILFSVCSFALPSVAAAAKKEETTAADNAKILEEELQDFIQKNGIDGNNLSFGYMDFGRELTYIYNGDKLFASSDGIKFPLAYLYYKDLVSGRHHLNEDVGNDNLRTVFLRSLTKDFGHDDNATELLIEKYGGMEAVKRAMYEVTYTAVDDAFFESDVLSANFAIDFLSKYYNEALYCSTDFKHMLIDSIKQFCSGRYSETYIYDCKITHRYGFSRPVGNAMDMGIINASNPFAFVISIENSKDPEEDIALLADFAYNFNEEYGTLLMSQMTTLPDVDAEDKKNYDATTIKAVPIFVTVISVTVVIAATITTVMIVRENKKKKEDRLD
ncbi:MAG: hypothetical protein IJJ41_02875 [Clostridia bacterium]|nr:hypothetical protein [Clostridia bacterium]